MTVWSQSVWDQRFAFRKFSLIQSINMYFFFLAVYVLGEKREREKKKLFKIRMRKRRSSMKHKDFFFWIFYFLKVSILIILAVRFESWYANFRHVSNICFLYRIVSQYTNTHTTHMQAFNTRLFLNYSNLLAKTGIVVVRKEQDKPDKNSRNWY